jgi:hypothetical protein
MNKLILFVLTVVILSSCNLTEGLKETGDAITKGTENVVEGIQKAPADISKASNKVEADIKD